MAHQINWLFEKKKKILCTLANRKQEPKTKQTTHTFLTTSQIRSFKDCNYGMSVFLDIIRYYTAEKNSQDIREITCLRLSQTCMYDTVNAPNVKKILSDAAVNLSNYYI